MSPETDVSQIQPAELAEITRAALPYLGPYSITTVKRFSKSCNKAFDLCELVATQINGEIQREAFLTSAKSLLDELATSGSPKQFAKPKKNSTGGRPASALTPELVDRGQSALANIIGPLASVLVNRYAGKAENSRVFFELLAGHLRDVGEREKFFSTVRGLSQ